MNPYSLPLALAADFQVRAEDDQPTLEYAGLMLNKAPHDRGSKC
jgi:hypothetical protein